MKPAFGFVEFVLDDERDNVLAVRRKYEIFDLVQWGIDLSVELLKRIDGVADSNQADVQLFLGEESEELAGVVIDIAIQRHLNFLDVDDDGVRTAAGEELPDELLSSKGAVGFAIRQSFVYGVLDLL